MILLRSHVIAACLMVGSVAFAQEGHPLTGTWVGDWGSPPDRRHVTVVLEWDGKSVTGSMNPGPNAAVIRSVAVDVATWSVRIEAMGKESIAVSGRIANIGSANRSLAGTWTEGSKTGAITLSRVDSLSVSSGGAASIEPIYSGPRVTLKGVVTNVEWSNPRAFISLDRWRIDIGSAIELERSGWNRRSIGVGDMVTVQAVAATDEKRARASSVVLTSSGKRFLLTSPESRQQTVAVLPAPRKPDGQIRLGPPAGAKGYWGAASANPAIDKSAMALAMPWARAVYEFRQRTKLRGDPLTRCVPPGGPRQFFGEQGFQFVEQRELGRILILFGDGDRNWRIIYTDGRPQGQPADVVSSYYGSSVGRWDKDTLVVDSVGYNEKFWFMNGGLPHTEALHLTERFTRTDMNTLKYDITVDDPRTYTKPWNASYTMRWVPDQEIQEFFCEEKTS